MAIAPDHYQPLFEHVEKTYPGLKLFAQWEAHVINRILETHVFIFDLERDAEKPVYALSIHPRDLALVLLGGKFVVPFSTFSKFLKMLETGEKPDYPMANYE